MRKPPGSNLAVMLEKNRNAEIGDRWETLLAAVRKDFSDEHPTEARQRLEMLKED